MSDCTLSSVRRTLRKPAECWGCARTFQPGQRLRKWTGIFWGEFQTTNWCETCTCVMHQHDNQYYDDGYSFGEIKSEYPEWEETRARIEDAEGPAQ